MEKSRNQQAQVRRYQQMLARGQHRETGTIYAVVDIASMEQVAEWRGKVDLDILAETAF